MDKKKLRGNLLLFLTSAIWGLAFVVQKNGMDYIGPFTFNCIRTFIGAIILVPVIVFLGKMKSGDGEKAACGENAKRGAGTARELAKGGICIGVIFFAAMSLQQAGLQYTAAGKAGFITALYIVLVPVFGLLLGNKSRVLIWVCVAAAAVGLFLLCVPAGEGLTTIGKGEIMLFISAIFLAMHILAMDHFVKYIDSVRLSQVQFAVCAALSLPLMIMEAPELASIAECWFPIFYTGVLSIGGGFTLQAVAQRDTDPVSASLIMSFESVISVIAGAVLLNEMMSARELIGCAVMFAAIIVSQLPERKTEK